MEGQSMALSKHALFWNNKAVNCMCLATMVKVTHITFKKHKSVHSSGTDTKSWMDGWMDLNSSMANFLFLCKGSNFLSTN